MTPDIHNAETVKMICEPHYEVSVCSACLMQFPATKHGYDEFCRHIHDRDASPDQKTCPRYHHNFRPGKPDGEIET